MNPKDTLKLVTHQLKAMKEAKEKTVAVGVLASEATGRIYESGANVIQVAAANEFGTRNNPQRSFLRMPQEFKQDELKAFINKQFNKVLQGMQVEKGLGLVGVYAANLSQDAFSTGGFGQWPDIKPETKRRKGSSAILIDTATLKNSVTWEIR